MPYTLKKQIHYALAEAQNDAKQTRRRMTDDRFCPKFFHTYRVAKAEAINLLAPHYKLAHRMSNKTLENKLNYRTRKLMEASDVLCFSRFSVVDPAEGSEDLVQRGGPGTSDKPLVPTEPPYEMMREQEAWFYQFHRQF